MGTIFAVAGSSLAVAYLKIKMLAVFLQIYPRDFIHCFIGNYFRFFDDIFDTWLLNFDIKLFYKIEL